MVVGGATLEYDVRGSGEPVLLIHGSALADAFLPLTAERALLDRFGLVRYHRQGFAGSDRAQPGMSIADMADQAAAILKNLALPRAHVVGHSYGGLIALEAARRHPGAVHTLALLEPALMASVPSGPVFMQGMQPLFGMIAQGLGAPALDAFLTAVNGAGYRAVVDRALPGAMDLAVADLDTLVAVEAPALATWSFTAEDAAAIDRPALCLCGGATAPVFAESHEALLRWLPRAEGQVLPRLVHLLPIQDPRAVAEALAAFFGRHPM